MDDGIEVPPAWRHEELIESMVEAQVPGEVAGEVAMLAFTVPERDEFEDTELDTQTSKTVAHPPSLPNARPDR